MNNSPGMTNWSRLSPPWVLLDSSLIFGMSNYRYFWTVGWEIQSKLIERALFLHSPIRESHALYVRFWQRAVGRSVQPQRDKEQLFKWLDSPCHYFNFCGFFQKTIILCFVYSFREFRSDLFNITVHGWLSTTQRKYQLILYPVIYKLTEYSIFCLEFERFKKKIFELFIVYIHGLVAPVPKFQTVRRKLRHTMLISERRVFF